MFQFRRFPSYAYLIQRRMTGYCPAGLPHSEIPGSMDICSSPRLIAACHVLLRLLMPRHSPCALSSLTFVGAKSARLRFRRQPMAVCDNCARFLAPPLQRKPTPLGFALGAAFGGLYKQRLGVGHSPIGKRLCCGGAQVRLRFIRNLPLENLL